MLWSIRLSKSLHLPLFFHYKLEHMLIFALFLSTFGFGQKYSRILKYCSMKCTNRETRVCFNDCYYLGKGRERIKNTVWSLSIYARFFSCVTVWIIFRQGRSRIKKNQQQGWVSLTGFTRHSKLSLLSHCAACLI